MPLHCITAYPCISVTHISTLISSGFNSLFASQAVVLSFYVHSIIILHDLGMPSNLFFVYSVLHAIWDTQSLKVCYFRLRDL
jgi:hypothetical protein